ncbi:Hypothetical predicted protein [Mytilus galloprovincialis]|uniref:Uncharacterized protein n=1 Tax=Mytilus galloprovincialis TaxID=29158 RepID=A0A8B6DTX4_MYTGA|nr:Hypothetical predicted protein [Mytilus galloprovincialis]
MKVPTDIEKAKTKNEEEEIMVNAIQQCLEDESCLPLIKEEIKLKIQCKRVESGKEELKVDQRRRVQYSDVNSLEEDQCSLEQTIDSLKTELQTLDNMLKIHKCSQVKLLSSCGSSIQLLPTGNNLAILGGM